LHKDNLHTFSLVLRADTRTLRTYQSSSILKEEELTHSSKIPVRLPCSLI